MTECCYGVYCHELGWELCIANGNSYGELLVLRYSKSCEDQYVSRVLNIN